MHTSKVDISRQSVCAKDRWVEVLRRSSQIMHSRSEAVLKQHQPTTYGVTVLAYSRRTIDLTINRASTTRRSIVLHLAAAVSLCISPLLHRRYSSAHNPSLPPMSGPRYQGNQISGDAKVQLGDIYNISSFLSNSNSANTNMQ